MKEEIALNKNASIYFNKLIENEPKFKINSIKNETKATILDCGIHVQGGFKAGKYLTLICMAGLAEASIQLVSYDSIQLPTIFTTSDYPVISTLGSQYAGWSISKEGYFAMGSGPARILSKKPKEIYNEFGFQEKSASAYIVLEADKIPPNNVIEYIATKCKIAIENLFIMIAPTASIAGSTQISGRAIETAIHKLHKNGMDVETIIYATGSAPIAPIMEGKNDLMMGRTNDMLIYGSDVHLQVKYEDEKELAEHVNNAVSANSKAYGTLFIEEVKKAGGDFYKIDPNIFSPAKLIQISFHLQS
ncbi:MAG: methenyltetrahydromethanopterin cyclohydrolase [Candidatus Heimdallarchaeota archaeon]